MPHFICLRLTDSGIHRKNLFHISRLYPLRSENTGKFLLRNLATLTNSIYCKLSTLSFDEYVSSREFLIIFWSVMLSIAVYAVFIEYNWAICVQPLKLYKTYVFNHLNLSCHSYVHDLYTFKLVMLTNTT